MSIETGTTTHDLLIRLQQIEAIEAIRETVARFCDTFDARNLASVLELFAPNAVLRSGTQVYDGTDAIRQYFEGVFTNMTFVRHHVMNDRVVFESARSARFESYFLAMQGYAGRSLVCFGRYADRLEKSDGVWRFLEKVANVDAITTVQEGWAGALSASPPWRSQ